MKAVIVISCAFTKNSQFSRFYFYVLCFIVSFFKVIRYVIREVCKANNIPVIDLFEINPIDPGDAKYMPDGLHPNDKGHSIIADIVGEALLKL